jgi:hypothetical protein
MPLPSVFDPIPLTKSLNTPQNNTMSGRNAGITEKTAVVTLQGLCTFNILR